MMKYKVYFKMEGDTDVWANSEEEAREKFCDLDPVYLSGQTYSMCPEIDDLRCVGESDD